jgi:predicted RNA-binding Zn ribbon-like protein
VGEILALPRVGGHPALDFANTAGLHASPARLEHLHSYRDLLDFAGLAGIIPPRLKSALRRRAESHPRRAARALQQAVAFRETVYRIFTRLAQGRTPDPTDLDMLHRARLAALRVAQIVRTGTGFAPRWSDDALDLLRPIRPLAVAAADLLESSGLDRLRQCANHPCGWVFLDRSKNGSRRWCSSEDCGNATRVRRFRRKQ